MGVEGALDLGGVDVLAARDDHVLDAVVDVEIAVRVHVACVAGADPALGVLGLRGRLGVVVVAGHVVAREDRDLADLADGQFVSVRIDDLDLRAGQRLAGRAQPLGIAGAMVLGRQEGDGAGGLGHAVALAEVAAEDGQALLQQGHGHGRRAVGDVLHVGEVGRLGLGRAHDELQRRGHQEGVGDAAVDEQVQRLQRVELPRDDRLGAVGVAEAPHADAADMGEGHAHQHDRVVVHGVVVHARVGHQRALAQQVVMAQHHALGQARGAGGEQHQADVVGLAEVALELGRLAVAPVEVGGEFLGSALGRDDGQLLRELVADLLDRRQELGADGEHVGDEALQDLGDLGRRQAPVQRAEEAAGLGRADEELEGHVGVLAPVGDVLRAQRLQPVRDLVGVAVELGEGGDPALELVDHHVGAALGVGAGERAHRLQRGGIDHSVVSSLSGRAAFRRPRRPIVLSARRSWRRPGGSALRSSGTPAPS